MRRRSPQRGARSRGNSVVRSPVQQIALQVASLPNMLVWLDAAKGVGSTGGSVNTWTSQAAGNHVFSQTGTARPTFSSTGLGGHPALLFSASLTQTIESTTAGAAFSSARMGCSVYYVAKVNSGYFGTGCCIWSAGTVASTTRAMTSHLVSIEFSDTVSRTTSGGNFTAGTQPGGGEPTIISTLYGPTSISSWSNGVLSVNATANAIDCGALDIMVLGGRRNFGASTFEPLDGAVGELLVFSGVHDTATRQLVESYLTAKYANAVDQTIQALAPRFWFRGDNVVGTAAKVTKIYNKVLGATDYLVMTGTLTMSGSDTTFGGRPSLNFTTTQWADSNLMSSSFNFTNGVNQSEVHHVFAPLTTATGTIGGTHTSNVGMNDAFFSNMGSVVLTDATGSFVYSSTGGTLTQGSLNEVAHWVSSASSPQATLSVNDAVVASGSYTTIASVLGPQATYRIGADTGGGQAARMRWVDTIIFDRLLTSAERATWISYRRSRYGS